MTIVAWDGKGIAADRLISSGGVAFTGTKLQRLDSGIVLSHTGNSLIARDLEAWYKDGAKISKYPEKYQDESAELIVIENNVPRMYHSDHKQPLTSEDEFMAWGAGREVALGAMAMGANAIQAVEIASRYCLGCGRGVDYYETAKATP